MKWHRNHSWENDEGRWGTDAGNLDVAAIREHRDCDELGMEWFSGIRMILYRYLRENGTERKDADWAEKQESVV